MASLKIRTRDVDIAACRFERTFGNDEPVAGLVRLQPADVEIHFFREAEPMAADVDQVAGRHEGRDVPFERGALFARHLQNLQELAHAGRVVHPLPHERQNLVG